MHQLYIVVIISIYCTLETSGNGVKHEQHTNETDQLRKHVRAVDNHIKVSATHTHICDPVAIMDAVARNQYIFHKSASICPDQRRHDNDALVMSLCSAPERSHWQDGDQVLKNGTCATMALPYIPVFFHVPSQNLRRAGILVSCNGHEIKVFTQECNKTPYVMHVTSNPLNSIYILNWT